MLSLSLSVLFASLIFVVFKFYEKYEVDTLYAIVINYLIASTIGFALYQGETSLTDIPSKPWFLATFALGFLFIGIFNLVALTAQKHGVSVTSVAAKMSLVVPVVFGIFLFGEDLSALKILGIVLALAAVYFASMKEGSDTAFNKNVLLLPLGVFLGSGIIDASINYIQEEWVQEMEYPLFSATVFGSAALVGIFLISFQIAKGAALKINLKNFLGGISLGIPNYFAIFFLLKALKNESLNSASVFTINNVAVVMFTTLLGILLFKEQISLKNWIGIGIAIVSIILVALF